MSKQSLCEPAYESTGFDEGLFADPDTNEPSGPPVAPFAPVDHSRGAGNPESQKAFEKAKKTLNADHLAILRLHALANPAGVILCEIDKALKMKRATSSARRFELAEIFGYIAKRGSRENADGNSEGEYFITATGWEKLGENK